MVKIRKNKFAINLIELDKSNWCAKFLTEYKGRKTFKFFWF